MEFDWQQAYARLERAVASGTQRSPEQVARILEERAQKAARPAEEVAAPAEALDLLVFSVGTERYGIETAHVVEVIPLRALTSVPCVPDFVLGVIHHRGRMLPVLDLGRLVGPGARAADETGRVVSLEVGPMAFGLRADAVVGVAHARAAELAPPAGTDPGGRRTLLRGVSADGVAVLDVEALAADARLVINEEAV
jgi:purine-binding chemotaxis protein CheW